MPSPYFLPENIVLDIGTQVIVENDLGSNPVTISLGQRHILYGITYMRNLKKKKKKVKPKERKKRMAVARGWGMGKQGNTSERV